MDGRAVLSLILGQFMSYRARHTNNAAMARALVII
jgi:hypothetical protein